MQYTRLAFLLFWLMVIGLAPAMAQGESQIAVSQPWARASILPSRPGVAYITLRNNAKAKDRLLGVTSPWAEKVMIHSTTSKDGIMRMQAVNDLAIGPGQVIKMKPAGMHLMLTGLRQRLTKGEQLPIVLQFQNAGQVRVAVPIHSIASLGPKDE